MEVRRLLCNLRERLCNGVCKQVDCRRRNNGCSLHHGEKPWHHRQQSSYGAFPSQYLDPPSPLPQEFTQPPRGCYLGLYNLLELNSFIALFRHKALPLTYKFISLCRDHKATFKLPARTVGAQKKPLWYKVHMSIGCKCSNAFNPSLHGNLETDGKCPKDRWCWGGGEDVDHEHFGSGNLYLGSVHFQRASMWPGLPQRASPSESSNIPAFLPSGGDLTNIQVAMRAMP